jgi:prepilin-type N-terminal cleavage/methylation domain-containing protein
MKKGFTLIELLIVTSIAALIFAVVAGSSQKTDEDSYDHNTHQEARRSVTKVLQPSVEKAGLIFEYEIMKLTNKVESLENRIEVLEK